VAADSSRGGDAAHRVLLLGPPNSGKGTQAKILAEHLEVPHVSTGDMLREACDAGTELGERVRGILAAGELVDDDTMAGLVAERLSREDAHDGFLLDGYPRTLRQVEDLERILGETAVDTVALIEVPEEELIERGLGRGREDDTEEVIRKRIQVYRRQTEPLVEHYGNMGVLEKVDGDRPIADVTEQLLDVLGIATRTGA
jgi:adenylate kinase